MRDKSGPGRWRDTAGAWSGWACVLLYLSVVSRSALGKLVDGNVTVYGSNGRDYVYEGGSVGSNVSILLLLLAAVTAGVALLPGKPGRVASSGFRVALLLCLCWWVFAVVVWRRGEVEASDLVAMLLGLALFVGICSSPPKDAQLRLLNVLRDTMALASVVFCFAMPSIAQRPCREDKCGLFGGMWTGFAYHENSAATAYVILLPLALLSPHRWQRWAGAGVVTVLVLGSGSRTVMLALLVAISVLVLGRRWVERGVPRWALMAPLGTYIASTFIYLGILPVELTGRDWVYGAIRDATSGYDAVFGAGSAALKQGTGGWIVGEHGQVPHVVLQTGWVGYVLFFLVLLTVAAAPRRRGWRPAVAAGVLLVCSVRALTEPALMFEVRTVEFLAMILAATLLSSGPRAALWAGTRKPRSLSTQEVLT